jgi:hypothetical protein
MLVVSFASHLHASVITAILTSIPGWDAETKEITLRTKGIRRYFFTVQLHSLEVKQKYLIYRKWAIQL